jgi:hypothetical protein
LIVKIQEYFQFGPGWYRRQSEILDLVLQYYFVLRSVLRAKPCLRQCLTRCRHCRIFFLTHPSNAGRRDLGCPFGCRDEHRKRHSSKRSTEYYQTAEGKFKKRMQNSKRTKVAAKASLPGQGRAAALESCETSFNAHVVDYLGMAISLIEGRPVSTAEILKMLSRAMRQRSLVQGRRIDYVLRHLNERAP